MAPKPPIHTEEEVGQATATYHAAQPRRKGIGTRVWLVLSELGQSHLEEVGKHPIMKRTGLPARDLRVLDPMLSYPSTIFVRERAIVVNLEHIKAIITAKEVLMVNSTNPLVVQFVHDLQDRVYCFNGTTPQAMQNNDTYIEDLVEGTWGSTSFNSHHHSMSQNINVSDTPNTEKNSANSPAEAPVTAGPKLLPFEFRALEACLESACRCLESETQTLEEQAYPALDELTSKISTLNLERVRQIKSRLVAISGRVQKVRDELEHLLDDDNDMAEMYLTDKDELDNEALEMEDERDMDILSKSETNPEMSSGFKPNIEELEMLLEAYFAQIDGVSQKLGNLKEYVDDTEDFINIMLDDKQNQLLQMGVVLSTANIILNAGIVVVGLFGMNIGISLFDGQPIQFWETVFGTVGGCVALYLIALGWGKKRSLL